MNEHVDLKRTLEIIDNSRQYNSWLYHAIEPYLKGVVLDVGSGIGSIAHNFINHPLVSKLILSDANIDFVSILKGKFSYYEKIDVIRLDISCSDSSETNSVSLCDTITCINVLEHIEDDISALENLTRHLKKEGTFILVVPNLSRLYGSLDKASGHYRRYDKKSLSDKLISCGYFPEKIFYINMAGIITWFLAGKVLRKKIFPDKICQGLDKHVPLIRQIEKIIKPFFGQSMIMVSRLR